MLVRCSLWLAGVGVALALPAVARAQDPAADWLWPGFIARGNITLLTSLWKSGKTTLVSHLLARRKSGGDRITNAAVTDDGRAFVQTDGGKVLAFRSQAKANARQDTKADEEPRAPTPAPVPAPAPAEGPG